VVVLGWVWVLAMEFSNSQRLASFSRLHDRFEIVVISSLASSISLFEARGLAIDRLIATLGKAFDRKFLQLSNLLETRLPIGKWRKQHEIPSKMVFLLLVQVICRHELFAGIWRFAIQTPTGMAFSVRRVLQR
jgi:hypothetical protein